MAAFGLSHGVNLAFALDILQVQDKDNNSIGLEKFNPGRRPERSRMISPITLDKQTRTC